MSSCQKICQISEEAQPVLYSIMRNALEISTLLWSQLRHLFSAPIFLGNECIIVASQNRRVMEDSTILNFCRFTANGEIVPLEYITNDPAIFDYVFNEFRAQNNRNQNSMLMFTTSSLPELTTRLLQAQSQNFSHLTKFPHIEQYEPMDIPPLHTFHLSKATSTTELTSENVELPLCRICGCYKPQIIEKSFQTFCSSGCNTQNIESENLEIDKTVVPKKKANIFEQRKQRKICEDIV